jgi:uncharacterized protein (TIGR00255 family)
MPIESMTGFARHAKSADGVTALWELKSVNGKGLDIRMRLPAGWDHLEQAARQKFQAAMARGNIQASLTLDEGSSAGALTLNQDALRQVEAIAAELTERMGLAPPTIAEILSIRGVLEQSGGTASEALPPMALDCLQAAIDGLKQARRAEGLALQGVLLAQIDEIERLTVGAEADPSRAPESIRARIAENIALLIGASPALDESRLASEALFAASRADIREEIDRLKTHVQSARSLLAAGGAVGRKLDFLAQEFNREANTLCSKSNAASVTRTGLELKSAVDQFREQVQNLE